MEQDLRYKGCLTADCDGTRVSISATRAEDVEPLAQFYRQTWINEDNCLWRLKGSDPRSFQNVGGMFEIMDVDALRRRIDDPRYCLLTPRDEKGIPLGLIWYSSQAEKFASLRPSNLLDGRQSWHVRLREATRSGRLVYGGEILLSPENVAKGLPILLFYAMFRHLCSQGYEMGTGEVYSVCCDFSPGESMMNMRSYKTLIKTGGEHVGCFPPRFYLIGGAQVEVSSQVFLWDIPQGLRKTQQELAQYGIRINQECAVWTKADRQSKNGSSRPFCRSR